MVVAGVVRGDQLAHAALGSASWPQIAAVAATPSTGGRAARTEIARHWPLLRALGVKDVEQAVPPSLRNWSDPDELLLVARLLVIRQAEWRQRAVPQRTSQLALLVMLWPEKVLHQRWRISALQQLPRHETHGVLQRLFSQHVLDESALLVMFSREAALTRRRLRLIRAQTFAGRRRRSIDTLRRVVAPLRTLLASSVAVAPAGRAMNVRLARCAWATYA